MAINGIHARGATHRMSKVSELTLELIQFRGRRMTVTDHVAEPLTNGLIFPYRRWERYAGGWFEFAVGAKQFQRPPVPGSNVTGRSIPDKQSPGSLL